MYYYRKYYIHYKSMRPWRHSDTAHFLWNVFGRVEISLVHKNCSCWEENNNQILRCVSLTLKAIFKFQSVQGFCYQPLHLLLLSLYHTSSVKWKKSKFSPFQNFRTWSLSLLFSGLSKCSFEIIFITSRKLEILQSFM